MIGARRSTPIRRHPSTKDLPRLRHRQQVPANGTARRPTLALSGAGCYTVVSTRPLRVLTEWDESPNGDRAWRSIAGRPEQCCSRHDDAEDDADDQVDRIR